MIVAALLVLGGGGVYALKKHLADSPEPSSPVVQKKEPPKTTEPSRLPGLKFR